MLEILIYEVWFNPGGGYEPIGTIKAADLIDLSQTMEYRVEGPLLILL